MNGKKNLKYTIKSNVWLLIHKNTVNQMFWVSLDAKDFDKYNFNSFCMIKKTEVQIAIFIKHNFTHISVIILTEKS